MKYFIKQYPMIFAANLFSGILHLLMILISLIIIVNPDTVFINFVGKEIVIIIISWLGLIGTILSLIKMILYNETQNTNQIKNNLSHHENYIQEPSHHYDTLI